MQRDLKLILASASPARRKLLQNAGIDPLVQPSDFDESQIQVTEPSELVQKLAECKAKTIADQHGTVDSPLLILGCDSVLSVQGEIYGKPETPAVAIERWQTMRGQFGDLYTGHALISLEPNQPPQQVVRCQVTRVHFASVSDAEIAAYVATEEPLNCAGCFAIEGRGGMFVERLEGCHTNVIGLSLPLFRQMLAELGLQVTDIWQN